jgi:hypothetical protein
VCACGERLLLLDGSSHHCSITLDANAEPAADAVADKSIHENLMDVSANANTMLTEDICLPEENIHENLMDSLANVNTLHADEIFPVAECVTGGQPTIQLSGLPSSSDESAQESDSDLEDEKENPAVDSLFSNLCTVVPSNESPTPTPASTTENTDTESNSVDS